MKYPTQHDPPKYAPFVKVDVTLERPKSRWKRITGSVCEFLRSSHGSALMVGIQFGALAYWIAKGEPAWAMVLGIAAGYGLVITIDSMLLRNDTWAIERDIERFKDENRRISHEIAMNDLKRRAWNAGGQSVQVHDLRSPGFLFPDDKGGRPL